MEKPKLDLDILTWACGRQIKHKENTKAYLKEEQSVRKVDTNIYSELYSHCIPELQQKLQSHADYTTLEMSGWKLMQLIKKITCKPSNASTYAPEMWMNGQKQLINCHRGQFDSLLDYFKEIGRAHV